MDAWMEALGCVTGEASSAECIFAHVAEAARRLGFEQCAYGVRRPLPLARPRILLLNNYDPRWKQRYLDAKYLGIDPIVAHGGRSVEPVVWTDDLFRGCAQMWDEARAFGLAVGWSQSCFDAHGTGGMLSLARSHERITPAELHAKQPALRWLVNVAHLALSRALLAPDLPAPVLTEREEEILRWTADGKTSLEIAQILHLSVNTVNHHIKHALPKLGAATKAAAVACLMARLPHSSSPP
jgi:LuxR family transcriptional regulator